LQLLLGIVGRGSKRNGLMVLKEETADVVSFRESATAEQMPRVQAHGSGPRRERDRA
jgi:hypothetical protein